MIPRINVNYDLSTYMPRGSNFSEALSLLKKEFDDKGMAYVMVSDLTEEEAEQTKTKLSEISGVSSVTYIESENYINGNALYTITLSDYDSTEAAFDTVKNIIDFLSENEAYLTGQSAYSYYTRLETEKSILTLGLVIAAVILLVLLFTSKTYFELILMLIVFGVAVALNFGTNVLFDSISYISNLVSIILQLALSLDYSIILLHRYMEERDNGNDAKTATVNALSKGIIEIISSALTTIAGLVSLLLMSLPIGAEIGLSLAKGIFASLIAVIFFMPALLVIFDKPLMKTKHKSFVPDITKPVRAIVKGRRYIVCIFLVIVVLAGVGQFFNNYSFNYNGGSKIVSSQEKIKDDFGTLNTLAIIVPRGDYAKERKLAEYVSSKDIIDSTTALSTIQVSDGVYLTDNFTKTEFIIAAKSMASGSKFEGFIDEYGGLIFDDYTDSIGLTGENEEIPLIDLLIYIYDNYGAFLGDFQNVFGQLAYAKSNLQSENYSRLIFNIDSGVESDETFALLNELYAHTGEYYDEFYLAGESVACFNMSQNFVEDNLVVCLCSAAFILLILFFTFRNFFLPLILILAIQGGIWINFAIPFLAGNPICFIGYLIITAIQMGATIDYAIVITNRYQITKMNFSNHYDAMAAAENKVFSTVITSGTILTLTGFALGIASSGVVSQLGCLLGIGTLASIIIVLFVLPSLILVSEKVIDKTNFSNLFFRRRRKKK
ncbi:MAG TPA: MMPL family transporter [Clostridia bacterium]|nr:MMPL family transporter [Clostridia bacterium]